MRAIGCLLFASSIAWGATCPPPAIPSVAAGDSGYDAGHTAEVLEALATGALPALGDDTRPLSHDGAALWTRRWQLECAVQAGRVVSADALLRDIASEASQLLHPGQAP